MQLLNDREPLIPTADVKADMAIDVKPKMEDFAQPDATQDVRFHKTRWRKSVDNIDPLFYITCTLCVSVLLVGLYLVVSQNDLLLKRYVKELEVSNAEFTEMIASNASIQTPADTGLPVQVEGALSDQRRSMMTGEAPDTTAPSQNALSHTQDLEMNDIETLRQALHEKTQQLELLALENYELRLQIDFGSTDKLPDVAQSGSGIGNTFRDEGLNGSAGTVRSDANNKSFGGQGEKITTKPALTAMQLDAGVKRLLANGNVAYERADYPAAIDWYKSALQKDPLNRDANLAVAAAAISLEQYQLATDRYRHLLSIDPDDHAAFTAMLELSAPDNLIASELATHVGQFSRRPSALYAIIGHHYGVNKRWALASEAYHKAIATSAGVQPPADYLYNLAITLEHTGHGGEALTYYRRAIKGSQGNPDSAVKFDLNLALQRVEALTL